VSGDLAAAASTAQQADFGLVYFGMFSRRANPKYFLFHLSHRIFRRMHGALNVGKNDN
jgi:hypothetical protein